MISCARSYEFAKDQYVRFTEAELETLETEPSKSIDLKEFIPLSKIDPVTLKALTIFRADEAGEKPYRLLADAMAKTGRAALAELVTRGKENSSCLSAHRGKEFRGDSQGEEREAFGRGNPARR